MSCGSGGWSNVGSSSGGSHRGIPSNGIPGSNSASSRSLLNRQPPRHINISHNGGEMVRGVYPKIGECVVNNGDNGFPRGPGPADPYRPPQVPEPPYARTSQEFLLAPPPPSSSPHRQQEMRLGPAQHSSTFYRNGTEEDHKSESPSRKRQRLVCSPGSGVGSHHHHHQVGVGGGAPSLLVGGNHHGDQRNRPPPARLPVPPPPPHSYSQPAPQSRIPPHSILNGMGGVGTSPTRGRQYYGGGSSGRISNGGLASGQRHHHHHHHHHHHQAGTRPATIPPLPAHYPSTSQPAATVALALDVTSTNLVPVTLSLPLYTSVAPPAPPPTLPPCQMPSIIWATASASTSPSHHLPPHHPPLDMLRGGRRTFGECPHHHHHHHHHGGSSGAGGQGQAGGGSQGVPPWAPAPPTGPPAATAAVVAAALRATPPAHFPPPPPADSFELEIIVDQTYHRRAPVLQVSTPGSLAAAAASGILLSSDVPRRAPPRSRWTRTLPPPPPPVPGLFHFLTMITSMNDALSPIYPQRDLSQEPFPDNYEELLSLAERLGDAKPRGLTRTELDKLPSYIYDPSSPCGEQTSCVVCMCDFDVGHTLRKLHCCHMFHSKCVDKWLKANRTCPICRRDAAGNPPKVIFNTD